MVLALLAPGAAAAAPGGSGRGPSNKLDRALEKSQSSGESRSVIVTTKSGARGSVRQRIENHGSKVLKEHGLLNAMTVRVDGRGLEALINDPDVEYVSTDADMSPSGTASSEPVVSNLKQMLAMGNWFTGSSLTVAVVDSGISDTADVTGRIVGTFDFTGGQAGVAKTAIDEYGHGTHVAGLVGSSGATSAGIYGGVAGGVKLLSLRVLDKKGGGKTSDVIAALEFAIANRARFNIRVINLSLGHPIYESATTDPLVRAVEAAVRAGIVVVAAAGNYGTNPATGQTGYAGITSPGNAPSAITVGAASGADTVERHDDRVASYSSRGPSWFDGYAKPDVLAPGTGLLSDAVAGSTLAVTYPSLLTSTGTGRLLKLSGSSMATGVVSGLVAVMIEAHDYAAQQRYTSSGRNKKLSAYVPPPALTPNAIKAMLQYSATRLRDANGVTYDALTQGAGEVDGVGAVTLAYYADTAAGTGAAWMGAVTPTSQFGTTVEPWSQEIVWGTRLVTGSGLMEINQAAWQTSVTWGSGELDNIVWGTAHSDSDNIVWGTAALLEDVVWSGSVVEQDNIVWGTALDDWGLNIVWGTALVGVRESDSDNIVWGTFTESDNIVWGTFDFDNIVWGTANRIQGFVLLGGVQ